MAFWSIPMKETMKKNPTSLNMLCWAWSKSRLQEQKKNDSNKIHSVVCKRWCSSDWKKELLFPHYYPCKCQIIENDKILTFCNLFPPKLTKKAILKLNDANLSPQKKKLNKILDKTKDKPVVFLCSICLTWSLITPSPPNTPPDPQPHYSLNKEQA